jgi:hypothetical protein
MRRTIALLGIPAVMAVVAGPLSLAARGADGFNGTFGAVAAADAVRATWIVPHAPASDTVLDVGGPSAQAALDSIGGSQAFASFPYPGENAVTAPALIAGASGGKLNLPAYPFWVGSTYPVSPKAESGSGPYAIKAESTDTSSTASASAGLSSNGQGSLGLARSAASTTAAPDAVTSEATTEITAFAVGPLKIGQVLSSAKAVFSQAGTVTRAADTQVTGMMVGDTPVALTSKGLVVGSSPVPADPKPIEDALAQAKIGLEYMPRQDTDNGVVAPTVRVTQHDDSGGSITYILGRASAFAQGEGSEAPAAAPAGNAATSTDRPDSGPAPAAGPAPGPAPLAPVAAADPGRQAEGQVDVPTSFVLPDAPAVPVPVPAPAPGELGAGAASGPFVAGTGPPASTVVQLASNGVTRVAGAAQDDSRRAAVRLLVSASDATPLFVVLMAGLVAALGSALLLRRLGKNVR